MNTVAVHQPHPSSVLGYEGISTDDAIVLSLIRDRGTDSGPSLAGPRDFSSLNNGAGYYYYTSSLSSSSLDDEAVEEEDSTQHKRSPAAQSVKSRPRPSTATTTASRKSDQQPYRVPKRTTSSSRPVYKDYRKSTNQPPARTSTPRNDRYNHVQSIVRDYRNDKITALGAQYKYARENPDSCYTSVPRSASRRASSCRRPPTTAASDADRSSYKPQGRASAYMTRRRSSSQRTVPSDFVPRCAGDIPERHRGTPRSAAASDVEPSEKGDKKKEGRSQPRRSSNNNRKSAVASTPNNNNNNREHSVLSNSACISASGVSSAPVNLYAYRRMLVFPVDVPQVVQSH